MKQASNPKLTKQNVVLKSLDGPPLDFAFKSIRSLNQLIDNMPTMKTVTQASQPQQPKPSQTLPTFPDPSTTATKPQKKPHPQQSQSSLQSHFQIVRTIQTTDHNYMQTHQKKSVNEKQKLQKKSKKIVFPQTTSLFLGYNKITNIDNFIEIVQPVFSNLVENLMWVDLCHNRLVELSQDIGKLKNLKTLYLHANYIANFAQLDKVKGASQLRTLTIHANPLQSYQQFRIIVHSILPTLKKLDSTLLTKRQTERAQVLMKSMKKYPVIKNAKKPPTQSDNDEDQDN